LGVERRKVLLSALCKTPSGVKDCPEQESNGRRACDRTKRWPASRYIAQRPCPSTPDESTCGAKPLVCDRWRGFGSSGDRVRWTIWRGIGARKNGGWRCASTWVYLSRPGSATRDTNGAEIGLTVEADLWPANLRNPAAATAAHRNLYGLYGSQKSSSATSPSSK
jgi:hypothetical protein